MSLERLEADANGDLLYTFTRPWSDGTTGIKLSPLELLEKLTVRRQTAAIAHQVHPRQRHQSDTVPRAV